MSTMPSLWTEAFLTIMLMRRLEGNASSNPLKKGGHLFDNNVVKMGLNTFILFT